MEELARSARKIIPQFQSKDIRATVDFYVAVLGFRAGEPQPGDDGVLRFCAVSAGPGAAANIYFHNYSSKSTFSPSSAMISFGAEQLDEFYAKLKDGGKAEISEEIGDKEWGYRQFTLKDPDGNELTFFRFL